LSNSFSQNNLEEFNKYLLKGIRSILFILIPSTAGIILLRTEIVRIILGSGHFGWEQTITTANVLGYFALSLAAQGLIPLLSRAFYALQDTKTPTIISITSFLISIILGYILSNFMGVAGLALAFTIGSTINFSLLYLLLRKKLIIFKDKENSLLEFISKLIVATLVMIIFVQIGKILVGSIVDMQRFWGVFVKICGSIILGGSVYLWLCHYFKCEEINDIKDLLAKKFKINHGSNNE